MDKLVTGVMAAEVVNEITMGRGITKTMSTWQTVKTKPMWTQQQTCTNDKTHTQQPADQTEVMTAMVPKFNMAGGIMGCFGFGWPSISVTSSQILFTVAETGRDVCLLLCMCVCRGNIFFFSGRQTGNPTYPTKNWHIQYLTEVSTPLTFLVNILLYLFMWQHWRNNTLLQWKVVSVQLV